MIFSLSNPEQSAVVALGLRLKHAAVLYCDKDCGLVAGGGSWLPHGDDRPDGRASQSRSMVRLTSAGTTALRASNKRFKSPEKQHPHLFKFVLDTIDRADDPERPGLIVPRVLASMVSGIKAGRRLWLMSLADVVWVCAWPWSVDWECSALHQGLPAARKPGEVSVWLDRMQAEGEPLGEALAVWLATRRPTLAQALAVYSATRPIRDKHRAIVAAEAAHAKVYAAAQNSYWIERRRARDRGEVVPEVQAAPFIGPKEPARIGELRRELELVGRVTGSGRARGG